MAILCRAILDRVQVVASSGGRPPDLEGFRVVRDTFVRPQTSIGTYRRCRHYECLSSAAKIYWQYDRRAPWLAPWKMTLIADDQTGLLAEDVDSVIRSCGEYRLVTVEVAIDFSPESGVDQEFVQAHVLFGKSHPKPSKIPGKLQYGHRKSAKFVRCYEKPEVRAFRLELQLNSGLLRSNCLSSFTDLVDLATIIVPKHLQFVRIAWKQQQGYLQRRFGYRRGMIILKKARQRERSIHLALQYLRRQHIPNVHRFLIPLQLNVDVKKAICLNCERFVRELA